MGLIMLILIGTVPTAYALHRAVSPEETQEFVAVSNQASTMLGRYAVRGMRSAEPRGTLMEYLRTRQFSPEVTVAARAMVGGIADELAMYQELRQVPPERVRNFRNDLYVVSESMHVMEETSAVPFAPADTELLHAYRGHADRATKFIPGWVKVAVALALGLGTMIGWKRIVITVGEKIGKQHLTYAQGAAAEITAMITIGAADSFGLPVSTTHVLSSGVAGTMAANHSGIQWATVRGLLTAAGVDRAVGDAVLAVPLALALIAASH
jgi:PiT family inorganic phosphate transporter